MSTQSQVRKFAAVVLENLPELDEGVMQGWIQNPRSIQNALRTAFCPPEVAHEFKVWKTVRLGTGPKTADDFRKAIKDCGMRIGDWANDILGKPAFVTAVEATELDLVVVTVEQLGFKDGATREQIYALAKERGLEFCPPEVGPQLRLQYKDQPMNEWLIIGMEPIRYSDGRLSVFRVERDDDGLWLNGRYDCPGHVWRSGSRWVFVRPRK